VLPGTPISIVGAALRGTKNAPVILVEYSDFECPYCGKFAREIWPSLNTEYVETGKVSLAFRHLPIESKHRLALKAAESAECAGQQGVFWEMHDALFRQQQLDESHVLDIARLLSMDIEAFRRCLAGEMLPKVRQDIAHAADLRVSATPTFFVGFLQSDRSSVKVSETIAGAGPLEMFEAALNRALASEARLSIGGK
jgi:protein-disulfide isomerase